MENQTIETRTDDDAPVGYPAADDDFWYQALTSPWGQGLNKPNPVSAERIAAVYACKTAIAESVSMLPVAVFSEDDSQNKEKQKEHPLWTLLREGPNQWMDSFTFFEVMQTALLDTGNAYAFVERAKTGKILSILPLEPELITVSFSGKKLSYSYLDPERGRIVYPPESVFHVRYRSKDGLTGRSPIKVASDTINFATNLNEHGNNVFENGAFLSGFITAPHSFKDDERRREFMAAFKKFMGQKNAGKFALLEQGTDYKPYSQANSDAQFLELKQFSVTEIARIFRVPPHMIQDLAKGASFASIEQQSINFVQYTIQPWVTRWERAIKHQLLRQVGEEPLYVRFNVAALIRGDLKSRTESVVQALQYGLMTINEARNLLDQNAIEGEVGDEVFLSHNLVPASLVMEGPVPPPSGPGQPAPSQDQEPEQAPEEDLEGRFLPLFGDLLLRLKNKETKRLETLRKKPDSGEMERAFVDEHLEFIKDTLFSACIAAGVKRKDVRTFLEEKFLPYYEVGDEQPGLDIILAEQVGLWIKGVENETHQNSEHTTLF